MIFPIVADFPCIHALFYVSAMENLLETQAVFIPFRIQTKHNAALLFRYLHRLKCSNVASVHGF